VEGLDLGPTFDPEDKTDYRYAYPLADSSVRPRGWGEEGRGRGAGAGETKMREGDGRGRGQAGREV
jgi:hypothetical protein